MIPTPVRGVLFGVAGLGVLIVAWHVVAVTVYQRANGTPGPVPPPLPVFARAITGLFGGAYAEGLAATAGAAVTGYGIAVVIALVLGILVMVAPPLGPLAKALVHREVVLAQVRAFIGAGMSPAKARRELRLSKQDMRGVMHELKEEFTAAA